MLARLKWALEPVISRNVYLYHFARTTMRSLRLMLPHEKDYAAMRLFDAAGGIFLDVGANDGISALSIRLSTDRRRSSRSKRILITSRPSRS